MMTVLVKNMLTVMMMTTMMMMIEMGKMDDDTGVVCACYPASA